MTDYDPRIVDLYDGDNPDGPDQAFRGRGILTDQLRRAGLEVDAVRGDWQRTPFDGTHPIMVFEAHAV